MQYCHCGKDGLVGQGSVPAVFIMADASMKPGRHGGRPYVYEGS